MLMLAPMLVIHVNQALRVEDSAILISYKINQMRKTIECRNYIVGKEF